MSKRVVKTAPASNGGTFARLVEQIGQTQEMLQQQAVRSVNRALVVRNWLVGHYIVEFEQHGADRAAYGERLLKRLSAALGASSARGFSERSLELYRRFYLAFPEISQTLSAQLPVEASSPSEIGQTLSDQLARRLPLSWSHYAFLVQIQDAQERRFYELETANENWSIRELKRQFNSSLYERLALSRDKKKIRHQDLGQMQMYVNYMDRQVKTVDENPTVGIVLCKTKSDAVVEMTLPKGRQTIFASRYQLYLPSKAELRAQLDGPKPVRKR